MSGLIWIQTVWHIKGIAKYFFKKVNFKKSADDKNAFKIIQHAKIKLFQSNF